jgi:hypothetical protein
LAICARADGDDATTLEVTKHNVGGGDSVQEEAPSKKCILQKRMAVGVTHCYSANWYSFGLEKPGWKVWGFSWFGITYCQVL